MVIEAHPGARVVSPCDGMVVYAGEFRSYGPMVIVHAGEGHQFLLAGLIAIDAQVGQRLSAGQPIGTLARSEVDGALPQPYLQLLKDRHPIDPAPWRRRG